MQVHKFAATGGPRPAMDKIGLLKKKNKKKRGFYYYSDNYYYHHYFIFGDHCSKRTLELLLMSIYISNVLFATPRKVYRFYFCISHYKTDYL